MKLEELQGDFCQPTPGWLRCEEVVTLNRGLGAEKDRQLDGIKAGQKLRWPGGSPMVDRCAELGVVFDPAAADDARLRSLGVTFQIDRYPGESGEAFEARLAGAWDTWGRAGTPSAIVESIHAYGIPDVEIVEQWDGKGDLGVEYQGGFVVVLGPNFGAHAWAPLTMPFVLGESYLGIAGLGANDIANIARQTRKWKDTESLPWAFGFRWGDAPVLGLGLTMPFVLGGSDGEANGYVLVEVGTFSWLGNITLPFNLGAHYGP